MSRATKTTKTLLDQDIKKSVNITKKLRASVETQFSDCCDLQADKKY